MSLDPSVMRYLIVASLIGMALLAVFFLRERRLGTVQFLGWGLLIILLPLVGPFMAILFSPGKPRP